MYMNVWPWMVDWVTKERHMIVHICIYLDVCFMFGCMFICVHVMRVLSLFGRFCILKSFIYYLSCLYSWHLFPTPSLTLMCVFYGVYCLLLKKGASTSEVEKRCSWINFECGAFFSGLLVRCLQSANWYLKNSTVFKVDLLMVDSPCIIAFILGSVALPFVGRG